MRTSSLAAFWAAACLCLGMPVASAQQVPATPADVAQPGGKIALRSWHSPKSPTDFTIQSASQPQTMVPGAYLWSSAPVASESLTRTARYCRNHLLI